MNNTKTVQNNNSLYKLQDNSPGFISNSFPIRRLVRTSFDSEQAWIAAYRAENKKYFEAVLTNQKLEDLEREEIDREAKVLPKRKFIKKCNFEETTDTTKQIKILDGFLLMHLCCVEDPLNLSVINISNKDLTQIKEEDMGLFENIIEINANENFLNFESFRNFPSLKNLNLACNNIKTIRLKHEEFFNLESLDLSFNNLTPVDIGHLGILRNLKLLKLTGNNLEFLSDSFSKLYVHTKDNKKMVSEKFPNLEELYLDNNKLKEEDSFDVLSVLKKLKKLHLNKNCISCIPNLKIFRKNHVFQEFNKSYYKRKKIRQKSATSNPSLNKSFDSMLNETIVKDLDRPSSEMNIHNGNTLRNSFILEENEEELVEETSSAIENGVHQINSSANAQQSPHEKTQNQNKLSSNSVENFDKNYELPFPELVFIDLADNQITEEDDLIALASWPMLNEIIIYGNPIVYTNVGYPPLLKQYLIDRLGINVQKMRPLKPLKNPILVPQRDHRIVDTLVPKVPKMPIELKMLTYYNQDLNDLQQQRRSNLSSAQSNDRNLNEKVTSDDASDTVGHSIFKNENVYKPFKKDKILDAFKVNNDSQENENNSKNYNSFFMTQIDQEDNHHNINNKNEEIETLPIKQPYIKSKSKYNNQRQRSSIDLGRNDQSYEILFNIENEDQLDVPKDFKSSIKALKQMLDNPLIFREPKLLLDKPQAPYRTSLKEKNVKIDQTNTQPKLAQINEILESLKDKKTVSEMNLSEALKKIDDKSQYEKAKKLLEKAQKKYEEVKRESLKTLGSAKI